MSSKWLLGLLGLLLFLLGCNRQAGSPGGTPVGQVGNSTGATSLQDARKGFQTTLVRRESAHEPVAQPPARIFTIVRYPSPAGQLSAYLTPDRKDGKKHPAIIWITGGDCNTIDDGCWTEGPPDNDQSASAFRKAGVVMMFPSLRGGNDNPGFKEGFLGEIDDVVAAADYLSKQPHVDPSRIYLGGHSTGGTVALLVAEYTDKFRAIFSFGPVDDVSGYDPQFLPFDRSNHRESDVRSPGRWLASIKSPTFVFEGSMEGNTASVQAMSRTSTNPKVQFFIVGGATHFSILAPVTRIVAAKILRDQGPMCDVSFREEELRQPFGR